jgi:uncharacterized membrane protein
MSMNTKLSIGLLATLGLSVLLASALAQQPVVDLVVPAAPARRTSELYVVNPATEPVSRVGPSDQEPAASPNPDPRFSVFGQGGGSFGTTYTLSSASTRNAESQLVHRVEELTKKLGEAKSESERSEIKTELSQNLDKQFGLRQKRHQEEIAALEAKVKKLKELVEKRQENRREIIAKRLDQILSNAEGLGW